MGKTKPLIDSVSYLYMEGYATCLLVVAPNGVHRNWITDEIPTHMPDDVRKRMLHVVWKATQYKTQKFQRRLKDILNHDGLAVVVVAYESTITENFKNFARKLFASHKVFMVLDESHRIKSSGSAVKNTLVSMGDHAHYRRIASGTPLERPLDVYTQIRFLNPLFWESKGYETFEDFKARFAIIGQRAIGNPARGQMIERIDGYKNLAELTKYVHELGWRLTKEAAGLNLPPKVYSKRYCELSKEQARVYNELKTEFVSKLESGNILQPGNIMTRMLRLQQVICNFVACEAEQPVERVDLKNNPRMDLAVDEILDGLPHQAIVFSRFTADIDELCFRLGPRCVRYDGKVKEADRAAAKLKFQKGDAQFFIASKAAATGLTLVGAKTVMYYSNSFELITRLQSEDRAHRIGQTESVNYIDLICADTIDEYIVQSLRKKFDLFNEITQDEIRPWL